VGTVGKKKKQQRKKRHQKEKHQPTQTIPEQSVNNKPKHRKYLREDGTVEKKKVLNPTKGNKSLNSGEAIIHGTRGKTVAEKEVERGRPSWGGGGWEQEKKKSLPGKEIVMARLSTRSVKTKGRCQGTGCREVTHLWTIRHVQKKWKKKTGLF